MPLITGFRATQKDYERIKKFAQLSEKSMSEVLRSAVLKYIDSEEVKDKEGFFAEQNQERDRETAAAIRTMEKRFATLLVRLGIDLESLYVLAWTLTEKQPDREEVFEQCYKVGRDRFGRKLKDLEVQMVEKLAPQQKTDDAAA